MKIDQSLMLDIVLAHRKYKGSLLSSAFTDVPSLLHIKAIDKNIGLMQIKHQISELTQNECVDLITIIFLGQDEDATGGDFEDIKVQAQFFSNSLKDITHYILDKRDLAECIETGLHKMAIIE